MKTFCRGRLPTCTQKALVPEFKAGISHKEGTLRAVKYILAHPELQKEDPQFDLFCDHLAKL